MPNPDKKIIVIAGPNGAGKTTFAKTFLPQEAHTLHFINADLIAAGLAPFNPESISFKAARLMLNELDEYAKLEKFLRLKQLDPESITSNA